VGLVVFAGSAFLQLPFTLDRSALEFFLQAAGTEDLADTGSDIGAALTTAAAGGRRGQRDPNPRGGGPNDRGPHERVSDGENLEGELGDAVGQLRYAGVRVFTVGLGTPEGGAVPEPVAAGSAADPASSPSYRRNESGAVVISRLREPTLERIAAETGGTYVRYAGGPEIGRIATDLARLGKRQVSSRSMSRLADRFQWPLALALLFLAGETLLVERRRPGTTSEDGRFRPDAGP
jgi:Ca-activated chloride channel family protein